MKCNAGFSPLLFQVWLNQAGYSLRVWLNGLHLLPTQVRLPNTMLLHDAGVVITEPGKLLSPCIGIAI